MASTKARFTSQVRDGGVTTRQLKWCLKRRRAIEPIIGHLKNGGLLGRNYLKGELDDQMNVVLRYAGHNLRLVLKRLKYLSLILWTILAMDMVFGRCKASQSGVYFRCAVVEGSIDGFIPV